MPFFQILAKRRNLPNAGVASQERLLSNCHCEKNARMVFSGGRRSIYERAAFVKRKKRRKQEYE
jgi:hypothetical protein